MNTNRQIPGAPSDHQVTADEWASLSDDRRARLIEEYRLDDLCIGQLRPAVDEAARRFIETFKVNLDEETIAVVHSPQIVWTIARLHSTPQQVREKVCEQFPEKRFLAHPSGERFMGWEIWHWLLHDEELRYEQTWRAVLLNLLDWPEQKVNAFLPVHKTNLGKGKFKPYVFGCEHDYLTWFSEPPLHSLTRVIRRSVLGDRYDCVSDRDFGMRIFGILTGFEERYCMHPETNPSLNWAEARRRFQELVSEVLKTPKT